MEQQTCALYLRVSSEGQKKDDTIEGQRLKLTKFVKDKGWQIIDTYEDEGVSGAFIEGRADFERLLADIPQRKFRYLVVAEHQRIHRDESATNRGRIIDAFKDGQIKVVSPLEGEKDPNTFAGEVMWAFTDLMAVQEKRTIMDRFDRGRKRHLEKKSYYHAQVCYGLRKQPTRNEYGKILEHIVVIEENEASILRMVYNWITREDLTLDDCAIRLNEKKVETTKGGKWSSNRLSTVLRNESLAGTAYLNRYVWKIDRDRGINPKTKKLRYKLIEVRPKDHPDVYQLPVPAIFTREEFDVLRKKLDRNRRWSGAKVPPRGLLRGKLKCGICGSKLVTLRGGSKDAKKVDYYVCHNRKETEKRRENKDRCPSEYVNMAVLDEIIEREVLLELFLYPKQTLRSWAKTNKVRHSEIEKVTDKIGAIDRGIQKLENQGKDLLKNFNLGKLKNFTLEDIDAEKGRINWNIEIEKENKKTLLADLNRLKQHKANIETLEDFEADIQTLAKKLGKKIVNMSFADKRRLLEFFIPKGSFIHIYPRNPEDYGTYKPKGMTRHVQLKWYHTHLGTFNLKAVLEALREYDKSGTVPDYAIYYTPKSYKQKYKTKQYNLIPITLGPKRLSKKQ